MAQLRSDWVYTTRIHSTDAAFSKRSCHGVATVHLWTRPDKTQKAAALFSRLAVSQPMKKKLQPRDLSGVNYTDPAFSADPFSNPNFSSSKPSPTSTTTTSPCPDHLTPKNQPPPAKIHIPPPPPNSPALPEPTTTDISTVSSTINSSSFTTSLYSSPRPHPAVPPPPSNPPSAPEPHVHAKADMPQNATLLRRHSHHSLLPSKPEPKKRHGFLSKLLGLSISEPQKGTTSSSSSSPPPPSQNRRRTSMPFVAQSPPLPQNRSPWAQPVHQRHIANSPPETSVTENPPRQTRNRVAAEVTRITPTVAAPPPTDDQWMHQDLDRIDELDESSPFGGVRMHNGGPYEAVPRFVHPEFNSKPHVKPPRAQQNSGRGHMMSGDVYRNAQIVALQKGSLNLRPGQVLPHNLLPRVEISHHPYPQPDFQPQRERHHNHHPHYPYPEPNVAIRESRSPIEQQFGPIPINPSLPEATFPGNCLSGSITDSPSPSDHHDRTPSPTVTVIQYDDHDSGFAIGMAMMSPDENSQPLTNATTIVGHSPEPGSSPSGVALNKPSIEKSRLSPPPYTFEPPKPLSNQTSHIHTDESHAHGVPAEPNNRGPAFNMHEPTQLPARVPSSSSLSRSGTWQPQPIQMSPPQPRWDPSRREIHLEPPPMQERVTPPDSRLHRASTYALGSPAAHTDRSILALSLQRNGNILRSPDARSVQQSITTTSNVSGMTGSTQTREDYRRNRYLPKHLVMPTPLKPALQNQAVVQQGRIDPRAGPGHSLDPSLSKRRSTLVTSPIPRAENIPVAPSGGKLRKRVSLLGGKKEQAPPVASVSFLANIVTSDKNDSRAEKQRKNVLNKRK